MTNDNPIVTLLDAIGLPWRLSLAELSTRFATRRDGPYEQEVIPIETRPPLVGGLLRPLEVYVHPQSAPHLPPLEFRGQASNGLDAGFNIRLAADELRAALGPTQVRRVYNVLQCGWARGRWSIGLMAWPAEPKDPSANPAHERDPRLRTACHVTVTSGFRLAPSSREAEWIASYVPFAAIRRDAADRTRQRDPELLRDTSCAALASTIGWSRGGEALIFCDDELHLVARDDIERLEVRRALPAKGPGFSALHVVCRTGRPAYPKRDVGVTDAAGPDDLNELGEALAKALGKPCLIGAYESDC